MPRELSDFLIEEISLVPSPATGVEFYFVKSERINKMFSDNRFNFNYVTEQPKGTMDAEVFSQTTGISQEDLAELAHEGMPGSITEDHSKVYFNPKKVLQWLAQTIPLGNYDQIVHESQRSSTYENAEAIGILNEEM